MEPTPFRKENDLNQTSMTMVHVNLPGCKAFGFWLESKSNITICSSSCIFGLFFKVQGKTISQSQTNGRTWKRNSNFPETRRIPFLFTDY